MKRPLKSQSDISPLALSFAKIGFNLLGLELIDKFSVLACILTKRVQNIKEVIKNFIAYCIVFYKKYYKLAFHFLCDRIATLLIYFKALL
ncbi:hypothetical protein MASR2M54_11870 [Aliarcobacter cryaerophilus]